MRRFDENIFNDLLTNYLWISFLTNKNEVNDHLDFNALTNTGITNLNLLVNFQNGFIKKIKKRWYCSFK